MAELAGNIQITPVGGTGTQYPLAIDQATGRLAWQEGPYITNQKGSPNIPVEVAWEVMTPAGMGETKRISQDSMGCAFTTLDASAYGFWRLPPKRTTVTPDTPPVDKPTKGFETRATGGAVFNVGTFLANATDSTHATGVTHGLSVAPKAIIFWTAGQTADGTVGVDTSNIVGFSYGFTDGTTSRVAWSKSDDAAATSNPLRYFGTGVALVGNEVGTISNITATTFDITWNSAIGANIVHFMAIGGADVSASVDQWTLPATADITSVTGVGFQPDACVHISAGLAAASGDDADFRLGVMDSSGNQWATSIWSDDGLADSNTKRISSSTECLLGANGNASQVAMTSMDAGGFTVAHANTGGDGAFLVATLSLKGINVKAGREAKVTSATTQTAVSLGFTSTAFMLSSINSTTEPIQDHASISIGAASATNAVEAMSWTDEDNQGTTDVYGLDATALAMEMIDHTDGSEDSTATCGSVDMNSAGWLTWSAATGSAEYIYYLALGPQDEQEPFVYAQNGQRNTKMSISSTPAITVEAQHDFGPSAECGGNPAYYGATAATTKWYIPLGQDKIAEVISAIASSGDDTYVEMSTANGYDGGGTTDVYAQAFAVSTTGASSSLNRAFSGNKVDISTNGTSFGGDFQAASAAETITALVDSGAVIFVGTDSNLHEFDSPGTTRQLTRFNVANTSINHGSGMLVPEGAEVCFFPHGGLFYWNGERPVHVGVDANPLNKAIPNVSYEPFRVQYTEVVYGSDEWIWCAARVTESSVTKTYILAMQRGGNSVTWHSIDRFDGVARLIPIDGSLDSNNRLWFADVSGGKYGFYQLGPNGEPDAGRDSLGYGAASTTYQGYLPRTDWGYPHDLKQLRSIEVKTLNSGSTVPVQCKVLIDQGSAASVGAAIEASGVTERFWTTGTSDTGYETMLLLEIVTTSGFSTSTDLQILSVVMRGKLRPKMTREVSFVVDTSGLGSLPDDSASIRTKLEALVEANPPVVLDPDGNSLSLAVTGVEVQPKVPQGNETHYLLTVRGYVWKNS